MMVDGTTNYIQPNNSFFLDLLDHEKFLEKYEHNLRGEVIALKQTDSGQWLEVWEKRYAPKMNELGIINTISFLRTICEKMLSITNFDEDMMYKMLTQNIQDFTDRLVENWYTYEFASIADLDEINSVGRNMIIAQMSRSKDGMTLQAVTSNTTITESRNANTIGTDMNNQSPRPGSGGIIGKLLKL